MFKKRDRKSVTIVTETGHDIPRKKTYKIRIDGFPCGKTRTGIRRNKIRRLHFSPGGV